MTYRKICTYCGNDILERVSEEEMAVINRKRRNQRMKENREATASAFVFGMLATGIFILMPVISILMAGIR